MRARSCISKTPYRNQLRCIEYQSNGYRQPPVPRRSTSLRFITKKQDIGSGSCRHNQSLWPTTTQIQKYKAALLAVSGILCRRNAMWVRHSRPIANGQRTWAGQGNELAHLTDAREGCGISADSVRVGRERLLASSEVLHPRRGSRALLPLARPRDPHCRPECRHSLALSSISAIFSR